MASLIVKLFGVALALYVAVTVGHIVFAAFATVNAALNTIQ